MEIARERLTLSAILLVILVSYFWGLGIVGSKYALAYFSPFTYAGFRFLLASIILMTVARLTRQTLPKDRKEWAGIALVGLTHTTLLYAFLYPGMDFTTAGKTIVILNSQPFWVALAAPLFLMERKFNLLKLLGLTLGFLGVVAIFAQDLMRFSPADLKGASLVLGAALSWSAGTISAKRVMVTVSPLVTVSVQMFMGALILLILGQLVPYPPRLGLTLFSFSLVVGLAIFCACLPYFVWFWLLRRYPSGILSSFNFLQIIFSVAMAYPILGELPSGTLLLGAVLVSLGIYMVNRY